MATATSIRDRVSAALLDPSNQMITEAQVLDYVNYALDDISTETRSIIKEIAIAKVAGTYKYALPTDFLSIYTALYNDSAWRVLQRINTRTILQRRYSETTGIPSSYDVFRNAQEVKVSGTATTGGTTAVLRDNTKTWGTALGVLRGDIVNNITDSSSLIVDTPAYTSEEEVDFGASLTGGAENTFAVGDSYEILNPSSDRMALAVHPAPDASDTTGTESIAVIYAAKHRTISAANITDINDDLELDPELITPLITRAVYYGTVEQRGLVDQDVAQLETRYRHEMRIAYPSIRDRIADHVRLWSTDVSLFSRKFDLDATTPYARNSVTVI